MKLYIGTTKDNELVYIEWDKADNEQRKTFTLSGGSLDAPKTQEQGENEARERLSDEEYYSDIGYFNKEFPEFLKRHINFDEVAQELLNSDGWENVNGEYSLFGENENKEDIYLNYSSGGQHQEKIENFKNLWVNKEVLEDVYKLWDTQHLKPLSKKAIIQMEAFFEMYKKYCSEQEALTQYLKDIEN